MHYPALLIDRIKLRENAEKLCALFAQQGKIFHAVSKCFCAWEPMLEVLADGGIHYFADSRLENMRRLRPYSEQSLLLRLPMISEAKEVVATCDISLNSEWDTLCALSDAALTQGRIHGVILMLELGDRREGVMPEDADQLIGKIMNLRGVRLMGLGVNFNCYGGIIPDRAKMDELAELAERTEQRYAIELPYVSGGNSGSLYLLERGELPARVNHLRIGEALLLGRETSFGHRIGGLNQDVFSLQAEIIENKRKPSLPDGQSGLNALGEKVSFVDKGLIRRVILAIGAQDLNPAGLVPQLKGVEFLGSSSDHSIFDISDVNRELRVGEPLSFRLNYAGLLAAFTSPYVHKVLV